MSKIDWDVRITFNNLMVALKMSIPLILVFMVLSYQLITTAFVDDQVREDIEAYIAVLGILKRILLTWLSRFFDRWNAEEEEYIEWIADNIKLKTIFGEREVIFKKMKNRL